MKHHPNDHYDMDKVQEALIGKGHKRYNRYEKVFCWLMAICAVLIFIICKGCIQ